MGLFYVDTTYDESPEGRRKRFEYLRECAQEAMDYAKELPNENCPSFLWEPQSNDFDDEDDYRIRGSWSNPNIASAYRIRRKYSDYWEYIDAMTIYEDYKEYVNECYGDFKMHERAQLSGNSMIYIPKLPKLTNKKRNRMYIKTGFVPSRVDKDFILPPLEIWEKMHEMVPECILVDKPLSKKEQKRLERASDRQTRNFRANNLRHMNRGRDAATDRIIQFLMGSEEETVGLGYIDSLSAAIKEDFEEDFVSDFDKEWERANLVIDNKDGYLKRTYKEKRQLNVIEALAKAGYDVLGNLDRTGLNPNAIRALQFKYGNEPKLTKKQRKKAAKKAKLKKEKVEAILGSDADQRMQKILLGNRIRKSRGESTDFRLSDVVSKKYW